MDSVQALQFGHTIRAARHARNIHAERAAALTGVSTSTWCRLEQGKLVHLPPAPQLAAIAHTLKLSTADLLNIAGYPVAQQSASVAR